MKVKGLNGRDYSLKLKNKVRPCSKNHEFAREIIKDIFPMYTIYEEVKLPGTLKSGGNLFADFLIPDIKFIIEVHGEQHYKYSPFFHSDKMDFLRSKGRDQAKRDWAELNDFSHIELKHDERERWRDQIIERL